MWKRPASALCVASAVLVSWLGCKGNRMDSPGAGPSPIPGVTGLDLTGPDIVPPDSRMPMRALARLSDGSVREVTTAATWSVAPPRSGDAPCAQRVDARFSISKDGIITTTGRGEAIVVADYQGFKSIKEILVVPGQTFRLNGVVKAANVAGLPESGLPLDDVMLEVVSGTGTGQKTRTDEKGCYVLYGLSGFVVIKLTRREYPVQDYAVGVHSEANREIPLWPWGYPWGLSPQRRTESSDSLPRASSATVTRSPISTSVVQARRDPSRDQSNASMLAPVNRVKARGARPPSG